MSSDEPIRSVPDELFQQVTAKPERRLPDALFGPPPEPKSDRSRSDEDRTVPDELFKQVTAKPTRQLPDALFGGPPAPKPETSAESASGEAASGAASAGAADGGEKSSDSAAGASEAEGVDVIVGADGAEGTAGAGGAGGAVNSDDAAGAGGAVDAYGAAGVDSADGSAGAHEVEGSAGADGVAGTAAGANEAAGAAVTVGRSADVADADRAGAAGASSVAGADEAVHPAEGSAHTSGSSSTETAESRHTPAGVPVAEFSAGTPVAESSGGAPAGAESDDTVQREDSGPSDTGTKADQAGGSAAATGEQGGVSDPAVESPSAGIRDAASGVDGGSAAGAADTGPAAQPALRVAGATAAANGAVPSESDVLTAANPAPGTAVAADGNAHAPSDSEQGEAGEKPARPVLLVIADSLAYFGPKGGLPADHPRIWPNLVGAELDWDVELVGRIGWTCRDGYWALIGDPRVWAAVPKAGAVVFAVGGMDSLPSPLPTALRELIRYVRPSWLRRIVRSSYNWLQPKLSRLGRPVALPPKVSVDYLEQSRQALAQLRPELPFVAVLPSVHDCAAYGRVHSGRPRAVKALQAWSARTEVPLVDLAEAVREDIFSGSANPDGIHWGWAGHSSVATAMVKTLQEVR